VTFLALAPLLATLAGAADPAPEPPSLTLDAALVELDQQSLTLAQARSRADQAAAVVRESLAPLLPSAAAGVSYLRNSDAAELDLPPQLGGRTVEIQPLHSTTVSGSLRVPLLAPTAWYDLAAAKEAARAAGLSAEATRLAVRTSLAQSAHLAAAAEEQVAAAERGVENAGELVRSAERRVQAGTAAPLEITRARAEQVRRQSDLSGARAALDRSRLAVGILLGREGPVRVIVPEVEGAPTPELAAPGDALVAEALEHRPEVAAQAAQQGAAEAGVRSARARLVPQVSASASVFSADVAYPTGKKDGWRASLDLTWQLYDGGFRYGKLHEAEAQVAGARAGLAAERLSVRREVQDARRDLQVAIEQLRLARAQLDLASDSAASIRRSFDAGVTSSLDVIDANDRLYGADSGLAGARARLALARLALRLALGREE
jgi:outer membrane protein TolC